MKWEIVEKKKLARVFDVLLLAIVASFPYSRRVSSLLTVALALTWVLQGNFKNVRHLLSDRYFLLFSLLFFIPLISLIYSTHKDFSLFEKRSFLLLYPLIVCTSEISYEQIRKIFYTFSISCTVAALYILCTTLWHGEILDTEMSFRYLGITHVYLGLHLAFSILFTIYLLISRVEYTYRSALMILQLIFQLFFLFALGAKMSIISLLILICAISIYFIIKQRRWILGTLIILIPAVIFTFALKYFEVVYWRFYDLFDPKNYFVGDNAWNSIGVRVSIFTCSFEIYKSSPLLGTGVGDVQADLDQCYIVNDLPTLVEMNTHNQFLQFALGSGLISLIILLLSFFLFIRKAWRQSNMLYLSFLFIFLFCCLTECLLERQYGTTVFGFFAPLLFYMKYDRNPNIKNSMM